MQPASHRPSSRASATRRYTCQTLVWMGLYCALHALAIAGFFDTLLGTRSAWLLALLAAVPIAGQLWATLRLMTASDEYQRVLAAKRFIIAAGAAMALCSFWGFGETYASAPHLPPFLIVPLFWAVHALVAPFVRSSH